MRSFVSKLFFSLFILAATAAWRGASAATVQYNYTGSNFTNHIGGFFPANDNLSGFIVVDLDLIGGSTANQVFGQGQIPLWSLTDGSTTFTQSNAGTGFFGMKTNSVGSIVDWFFSVGEGSFTYQSNAGGGSFGSLPYPAGDRSFIFAPNSMNANTPVPGAWALDGVSAIPVPAAIWLFGTALIGLAGLSQRSKTAWPVTMN